MKVFNNKIKVNFLDENYIHQLIILNWFRIRLGKEMFNESSLDDFYLNSFIKIQDILRFKTYEEKKIIEFYYTDLSVKETHTQTTFVNFLKFINHCTTQVQDELTEFFSNNPDSEQLLYMAEIGCLVEKEIWDFIETSGIKKVIGVEVKQFFYYEELSEVNYDFIPEFKDLIPSDDSEEEEKIYKALVMNGEEIKLPIVDSCIGEIQESLRILKTQINFWEQQEKLEPLKIYVIKNYRYSKLSIEERNRFFSKIVKDDVGLYTPDFEFLYTLIKQNEELTNKYYSGIKRIHKEMMHKLIINRFNTNDLNYYKKYLDKIRAEYKTKNSIYYGKVQTITVQTAQVDIHDEFIQDKNVKETHIKTIELLEKVKNYVRK